MDVNLVNIYGVLTSATSIIILIYLIPQQIQEVKRPDRDFLFFRKRLLWDLWLALVLVVIRLPYFISTLTVPSRNGVGMAVSIATSTAILLFIYNKLKIFTYKETE